MGRLGRLGGGNGRRGAARRRGLGARVRGAALALAAVLSAGCASVPGEPPSPSWPDRAGAGAASMPDGAAGLAPDGALGRDLACSCL
ncbi:MAG: hypothetical protein RL456_3126 [Pseudomonadota bacterium]|jgi:hypothetical protein